MVSDVTVLEGHVEPSGLHRLRELPDGEWQLVEWDDDRITHVGREPSVGDAVVAVVSCEGVRIYTVDHGVWSEGEIEQARERGNGLAVVVGKWPGDETDEEINEALEDLS